jgi:hypothetical protein
MKYLILIHMNPANWEALPEAERDRLMGLHDGFQKMITDSGELISTVALADPTNSAVVRVHDGAPAVTDGPYVEAKEYMAGYYLVDCETRQRAIELAGQIPDAHINAMEVRPNMFAGGMEM